LDNHPQAAETQEAIAGLKIKHANEVQELATKQQGSEEEISRLREDASRLNEQLAALTEEKDFLSHKNRDLEAAVSRLSVELGDSSAHVKEADRMAAAANSKVRNDNISSCAATAI
jgi:chromosome segregation ATPase